MPLVFANIGNFIVEKISSGLMMKRRLAKMGIMEGKNIEVLSGNFGGPIIILVDGSRYGIGQNMAKRIFVKNI
ncbi:FeoA family protein [Oceanotoga teriensis]|uniref:Ferrous iron transport protein A n=1 Tax=Oceanotoga teriensis TaxID=515440 RepID=A0AA45C999_9BACT|nr:FeoA family protein [Oceanotoga teriensis]MDO7975324.1 ferrous iron transport protein A [Oceanotoga teriensis]PWJ96656.1 ferrous iron transport protein A [Oceanotoga teriensis]